MYIPLIYIYSVFAVQIFQSINIETCSGLFLSYEAKLTIATDFEVAMIRDDVSHALQPNQAFDDNNTILWDTYKYIIIVGHLLEKIMYTIFIYSSIVSIFEGKKTIEH